MHHRGLKVALVAVFTLVLVLGLAGIASAAGEWPDLSLSTLGDYGITEAQVAQISDGYTDGTWKPYANMPRKQFVKMAVDAYKIPLVSPATPSYSDVPASHDYYEYVEAATAAGLTNGVGGGKFDPESTITREQAAAIIARWVAAKNGYDLATMYSAAEITEILGGFGDGASVSPSLKAEMAFAVDFGIVWGDATGNLAPLKAVTRIQGAAMLIRSWSIVPEEPPVVPVVPAKVELVGDDEAENLIGLTHQYTFKVTQADGSAAPGVLVDFDTLLSPFYVGNIQPSAGLTDADGEVTVNLVSTEIGIQRVSAAAPGVSAIWSTKYWVALDEVYILDTTREAENNAGDTHTWEARAVVFGPGPLSTNQQDWYNEISLTANYDTPKAADGIDGDNDDDGNYADEKAELKLGYVMRSLPGIPMQWTIVNVVNDNPATVSKDETVASVGKITAGTEDAEIAANGLSAWTYTDEDGLTTIDILSEKTGKTKVTVIADYAGNPYSSSLFNHETSSDMTHWLDWDDQPAPYASAVKTWIPHVIGGGEAGPITPTYAVNNTGEVEEFTLELKDTFGNAINGYTVEWWIQGVGEFKTDDSSWSGVGEQNRDWDTTNASGKAVAYVKSIVPGQTILHVKVMDKFGLPFKEWNVVKQWYSIDDVRFTDKLVWDDLNDDGKKTANEMVIPENPVNTAHTFNVQVSGAKYVHVLYDVNNNGLMDDQALIGDRDDLKAAAGTVAKMVNNILTWAPKAANTDIAAGQVFKSANGALYTRFADIDLEDAEFWADRVNGADDIDEVWMGLEGKTVYFFNNIGRGMQQPNGQTGAAALLKIALGPISNTPLKPVVDGFPYYVGSITSAASKVTDADGMASVDINSNNKGYQYVWAVADYVENPQDGNPLKPLEWAELRYDMATKIWLAGTGTTFKIFAQDALIEGDRWTNPILPYDAFVSGTATVTIAAPPAGTAATGTATVGGGAVTGITITNGGAGYTADDVGRSITIGAPTVPGSGATAVATLGTTPPTNNSVGLISVTNGGSGYTVAPTVVISAPNIVGGTQATATATLGGTAVVSVTVVNVGSGYTSPPTVSFSTGGTQATATITTVVGGAVTAATVTAGGTGYPTAPAVTFPAPLRQTATATATVAGGSVTGLTLTSGGAGYLTAPAVTISGTGTGAAALAVLNATGNVGSLTLVSGGSGYLAANTAVNPNRETIAVQVFDELGNALEGYKVTFEVIGQGTTTAGTIPTYHPYAHFENPAHDFGALLAGLGDRGPFVNANPIWEQASPILDADYAWGYTLNHQINFVKSLASAAHVDLVLDDTPASLLAKARDGIHLTDIVNIKVYRPNGTLMGEREVTKVWSTAAPALDKLELSVGTSATGPWVTDLSTNVQPLFYKVQLYDQYGQPWLSNANVLVKYAGPFPDMGVFGINAPNASGISIGQLPIAGWVAGLHTLTAFYDVNPTDALLSVNELTSNSAKLTIQ